MRKSLILLFAVASAVHAQKAAEIFIPIGKSPGLSGKVTVIGTCTKVLAEGGKVTVSYGKQDAWTGEVTDKTKIYLDRSKLRLRNLYGTAADLRTGRRMEIKSRDGVCEWIKVEVTEPPKAK